MSEYKSGSNLEKVLTAGHFAATGELGPPQHADPAIISKKAQHLKGVVDAVNITDNQTAVVRMASIAVGKMLLDLGIEPTIQMTCRDRNRIAIQADLLGASALGMKNLLCLSGDHQHFGNHPTSKNVFDLDSMQLLDMVRRMRDDHQFLCGDEMKPGTEPHFFIGAAANPFADPFEFRPYRLAKKIAAGADFIQTQIVFNVPKFREYVEKCGELGLLDKVYLMAGVSPIRTYGAARYMANNVPGMDVPQEYVDRMRDAVKGIPDPKKAEDPEAKKDARRRQREAWDEEGIKICVEVIQQVREIPGVRGVHIMAIEWESAVPEITKRAGLLPRPQV
ncbi:MAG: methylenetetrahydrofolate reductase [Chloroflexi bacterium]|nr:methylenetetrahydrofolate reductase [Chloroflexota bacterium]MBU1748589.1 methylenetetrahydrofolate reductase [Chloroflexota bacterium]MBU1879821.1 methylenetetrahydrofolate reductase [Chloroflexota bacterium]